MVSGNTTRDYALNGDSVVREWTTINGVTSLAATYLYGPRGPEYKRDGNDNVEWCVYDGLGSVVATVDPSGNVLDSRKYDVYGATRGGAASGTAHRFVGALGHPSDDETGLVYMRARYYDAAAGRFVSEDPGRNGANWFAYASGNPVVMVDRTGRAALIVVLVGILIGIWALLTVVSGFVMALQHVGHPVDPVVAHLANAVGDIDAAIATGILIGEVLLSDTLGSLVTGGALGCLTWAFVAAAVLTLGGMMMTMIEGAGSEYDAAWQAIKS